jgi:hypothetical protein
LTCWSEDPRFALPVKARRARARERLPSYREPASGEPAGHAWDDCLEIPHTRTVSPSAHPRPASGGATDFFLASALHTPTGLATSRRERRAMHLTDFCHPNETACARTSCVPGSLAPLSRRGSPTESWAPYGMTGGLDVSRRPWTASADRHRHVTLELQPHGLGHEAWALSSHGVNAVEPLTSLSRSLVHPRASPVFRGAAC